GVEHFLLLVDRNATPRAKRPPHLLSPARGSWLASKTTARSATRHRNDHARGWRQSAGGHGATWTLANQPLAMDTCSHVLPDVLRREADSVQRSLPLLRRQPRTPWPSRWLSNLLPAAMWWRLTRSAEEKAPEIRGSLDWAAPGSNRGPAD